MMSSLPSIRRYRNAASTSMRPERRSRDQEEPLCWWFTSPPSAPNSVIGHERSCEQCQTRGHQASCAPPRDRSAHLGEWIDKAGSGWNGSEPAFSPGRARPDHEDDSNPSSQGTVTRSTSHCSGNGPEGEGGVSFGAHPIQHGLVHRLQSAAVEIRREPVRPHEGPRIPGSVDVRSPASTAQPKDAAGTLNAAFPS